MTTNDFAPGDRVLYVPHHAGADRFHPDCERGVVSSRNEVNVFVLYYNKRNELGSTAQATSPDALVHLA